MSLSLGYRSYAKINLYLDVLDRRDDGYHNIESILQTVELGDDLLFSERQSRVSLTCTSKDIETGEDNLIHQAAMLLKRETGCALGVRIELKKNIPVAAGLAGGSGNAAATLIALNNLWNLGISQPKLAELSLRLGSDVPYCLSGGAMAATGRGEKLTRLEAISDTWFVLIHPHMMLSTAYAFSHPRLQRRDTPLRGDRSPAFEKALTALDSGDLESAVFNRFEEIVFAEHPRLGELKRRLIEAGCSAAAMSGTGSTLFGICPSKVRALEVAQQFPELSTSVVRPTNAGVESVS